MCIRDRPYTSRLPLLSDEDTQQAPSGGEASVGKDALRIPLARNPAGTDASSRFFMAAASDGKEGYTVTFDLDGKGTRVGGGELVQTVPHGGSAVAPEVEADPGWAVVGWRGGREVGGGGGSGSAGRGGGGGEGVWMGGVGGWGGGGWGGGGVVGTGDGEGAGGEGVRCIVFTNGGYPPGWYAGGGAGSRYNASPSGAGGLGGGGDGATPSNPATSGAPDTGGARGGPDRYSAATDGGPGIVKLIHPIRASPSLPR